MTKKIILGILALLVVPIWAYLWYRFYDYRIFIAVIPPVLLLNILKNKSARNTFITIFVIIWMTIFQYESTRHFYLNPFISNLKTDKLKELRKTKFLFPPAGWIMFFNVDDKFGFYEVYGVKGKQTQFIDPHDIFRTRTIGYDNIHRGILGSAARPQMARPFCLFLKRRFEYFDNFIVRSVYYPEMSTHPNKRYEQIQYQCFDLGS